MLKEVRLTVLRYFKSGFKKHWSSANNKEKTFLQKNVDWLENITKVPNFSLTIPSCPQKHFTESSERSKHRKTEDLQ